ncbi:MAG: hypothetical protein JNM78_10480 [Cyclobacteriaceae bacterium]|nr:hypothetical protein [Cyclobacteriaceae bacterium]
MFSTFGWALDQQILKKNISILLLLVFLFNSIGYCGLFLLLRHQFNCELTKTLDADEYSRSETMIIKIPSPLSNQINFNAYERVDGEFESDGEYYKLVKQKRVNDTLFVVLIKDSQQTKLNKSMTDFVQSSHAAPLSKSMMKLIDHFEKDFMSNLSQLQVSSFGWYLKFSFGVLIEFSTAFDRSLISPPPKL